MSPDLCTTLLFISVRLPLLAGTAAYSGTAGCTPAEREVGGTAQPFAPHGMGFLPGAPDGIS